MQRPFVTIPSVVYRIAQLGWFPMLVIKSVAGSYLNRSEQHNSGAHDS